MGLFAKLLRGADKVYQAKEDAEHAVFRDRSYDRAARIEAEGVSTEAIVVGIERAVVADDDTQATITVEWTEPAPGRGQILFRSLGLPMVIRLGGSVPVKVSHEGVAYEGGAVLAHHGSSTVSPPNGLSVAYLRRSSSWSRRDPAPATRPDAGVVDRAVDQRVLEAWATWTPARATVVSFERASGFLGMPAVNWDILLRLQDGRSALSASDWVPAYAAFHVVPGADVPVVVDPDEPGQARVVWPALAAERAGGSWRDPAPPGSVAGADLSSASAAGQAASVGVEPIALQPSAESAEGIEGVTIEQWAAIEAGLTVAKVPPAQHDEYAATVHGVPVGRYSAIRAAWNSRMMADWRVGTAYGPAYESALKAEKQRAKDARRGR